MKKNVNCINLSNEKVINNKLRSACLEVDIVIGGVIKIGAILKIFRIKKGMSLQEMAKVSGVQIATLSRMENNKAIGSLLNYARIAKALDLRLSELFLEMEKIKMILCET